MTKDYLEIAKKQFTQSKTLAEKTFSQLPDEKLFWQYNPESNSIGIIVKHMWGNMLSRWTDFLTTDGEKEWRQRDAEFENDIKTRQELLSKWNEGWQCLFNALATLTKDDLDKTIRIRNEELTVTDAISRQLAHYAYHVGQIVFIGKMVCDDHWTSLTIPRGHSGEYTAAVKSAR